MDNAPYSPDTRALRLRSPSSRRERKTSASSSRRTQSHRCAKRNMSFRDSSTSFGVKSRSPHVMAKRGFLLVWAIASAVAVLPTPGTPWRRITNPDPLPRTISWFILILGRSFWAACFSKCVLTSEMTIVLCEGSILRSLKTSSEASRLFSDWISSMTNRRSRIV